MGYELIIEPSQGWLRIPWREIARYRDLLVLLVRRDFVAQYKQTILGPLWFLLQPLLMTGVFVVVFAHVARIPTEGVPPVLFYLCGITVWNYFAGCLTVTSATFVANAGIFGKVYFPRLIAPLSAVLSKLISFSIQFLLFVAFLVYYKGFTEAGARLHPGWAMVLLPLVVLHTAAVGLGVGLWICALTARYRDLAFLLPFATQLWMFLTPVFYPSSAVPARWQPWVALNPMTGVLESYRAMFLGTPGPGAGVWGLSSAMAFLVLLGGLFMFSRVERTFIDTV